MMYEADCHTETRFTPATPHAAADTPPVFRLRAAEHQLHAAGCAKRLPAGPAKTLAARVAAFFDAPGARSRPLVGLLPFDPHGDDALYQPRQLLPPPAIPRDHAPRPIARTLLQAEPSARRWADAVTRCIAQLAPRGGDASALHKVVLARSLQIKTGMAVDVPQLARRLAAADPSVTVYAAPIPVAEHEAPAWLVGATPELLVSRRGQTVISNPLAGSTARSGDRAVDDAAAEALLASSKDQDEHRYVVEAIADALTPFCKQLQVPPRPCLQATRTMWHLGTRIEGRLKVADVSAAALAAVLHPTPAVCGTPTDKALQAINALEPLQRGFYAGAVGWVDAAGDGDWYLALRCARIQGRTLRLFAGAGIVADSQPQREVAETGAKFRAMLDALGIDYTDYF